MGIIRLTLISVIGVGGAMMWFGRDEGLPENRLGRERVSTPAIATAPPPTTIPAVAVPPVAQPEPTPVATPQPAPVVIAEPTPTSIPEPVSAPVPDTAPDVVPTPEPEPIPEATLTPEPEPEPVSEPVSEPEPEPETIVNLLPVLYVTGSKVNMRAGPSTNDAIVGALTRGTAVDFLGEVADGWAQIIVINTGATGFMSSQFLSPDLP